MAKPNEDKDKKPGASRLQKLIRNVFFLAIALIVLAIWWNIDSPKTPAEEAKAKEPSLLERIYLEDHEKPKPWGQPASVVAPKKVIVTKGAKTKIPYVAGYDLFAEPPAGHWVKCWVHPRTGKKYTAHFFMDCGGDNRYQDIDLNFQPGYIEMEAVENETLEIDVFYRPKTAIPVIRSAIGPEVYEPQ